MTDDEFDEEQQRLRDWNYVRGQIAFWKHRKRTNKYGKKLAREELKEYRKKLAVLMPPKNAANLPPIKYPQPFSDSDKEDLKRILNGWKRDEEERGNEEGIFIMDKLLRDLSEME